MARIGFHGFKSGTAVELALRKLGRKVQARTENWRDPDAVEVSSDGWEEIPATAEVEVTVHRSDMQVAPELIMVRVTGYTGFDTPGPAEGEEYDRRYHELYYLWDYDDPDGPEWTAPVNVMPHMRNANVGYGPTGAHVYTKPGTYNPSVIVYEPSTGKLAKHQLDPVVVEDPEVKFAGDKTVYVHKDGDYSKAPIGARTTDTMENAISMVKSLAWQRILVASDQTIPCPADIIIENKGRTGNAAHWRNFRIEGARDGARPILETPSGDYNTWISLYRLGRETEAQPGFDAVFSNIHVKGPWNGSEEYGDHYFGIRTSSLPEEAVRYLLLHDCYMEKFSTFVYPHHDAKTTVGLSNSTFYDWQDLAIFGAPEFHAQLGTSIRQNEDAFSGGPKYQPFQNHGPVRVSGGDIHVVDGSEYFSHNGWSGFGRYKATQPCWRWNFTAETGPCFNMQRTICEGGSTGGVLALEHMNNYGAATTNNILIEKTMLIGSFQSFALISLQYGGLTLRNVIGIMPDAPAVADKRAFVNFRNQSGDIKDYGPTVIESSTFVNLLSPTNFNGNNGKGIPVFGYDPSNAVELSEDNVRIHNNLHHQPNLDTPDVPYAPLDTTPIFEARANGYKVSDHGVYSPAQSELDAGSFEIPFPTSDWKGNYDPPLSQDDFANGNHYLGWDNTDRAASGEVAISITSTGLLVEVNDGFSLPPNKPMTWKMDRTQGPRPIERDTRFATPAGSVATFAPMEGSEALGAASEDTCTIDDFFGNRRPAYPSYGALELAD